MGDASYIFLPLRNELDYIEGEFGQVIKAIRKKLKVRLTHFSFKSFLDKFEFVALRLILLSLIFSSLIKQPLFSSMQVLIHVLRGQIC